MHRACVKNIFPFVVVKYNFIFQKMVRAIIFEPYQAQTGVDKFAIDTHFTEVVTCSEHFLHVAVIYWNAGCSYSTLSVRVGEETCCSSRNIVPVTCIVVIIREFLIGLQRYWVLWLGFNIDPFNGDRNTFNSAFCFCSSASYTGDGSRCSTFDCFNIFATERSIIVHLNIDTFLVVRIGRYPDFDIVEPAVELLFDLLSRVVGTFNANPLFSRNSVV
ncbi:hypothetical protein C483_17458 [Natrialba hulunbeirensis JCM 10989]|uniref:Uncharacterized protein n=1 Tax=Natrialba hulunbeirensis JCM 10989 TaxID=1227493 RepID=L9ZMW8_9EURY|nr:hypothetical protein C483_17458 [Natrialba hulunbeirensis JCM 10989]